MTVSIEAQTGLQVDAPKLQAESGKPSVGEKLEAVFLSEMLKASGLGETSKTFGGGIGEDQFASFLREAQAREMVRAGGLGLATIFDQAIEKAEKNG